MINGNDENSLFIIHNSPVQTNNMKRVIGTLTMLVACAYLTPLLAQNSACNAGFDYQINGKTVYFKSGNPTNHPQRHYWTFGDGSSGDGQSPVHTYNAPGQYRVLHYVKDSAEHCFDSVVKYITIQGTTCDINASFTFSRDNENCRRVKFTSVPLTTAGAHFIWKFGDGTTSNEPNPTHIYEKDGNYNVCLVIETTNGCRAESCKVIEIRCSTPPPVCNVKSKFEVKRDASQWNKVWFVNLSQPIANIWRTYWTYGDGTSSQDFNSVHVYQNPGKYYVCLKVQSLQGCIDVYCDSVEVRKPNDCENHSEFKFERSNNPHEYRFRPTYINLIWKYSWDFGDGNKSTAVTPIHTYKDSGVYKVCLTVVTNNGCETKTCKYIHVESGRIPGTANIYPNPVNGSSARVEYQMETAAKVSVRVLDATGMPKYELNTWAQSGNNYVVIPVDKLSSGLYLVEIRYGNQTKLVKFQKG